MNYTFIIYLVSSISSTYIAYILFTGKLHYICVRVYIIPV